MGVMNGSRDAYATGVLRRARTDMLVLAVPDLEEPYFAELTALVVRRAEQRGLAVIVRQTVGDHAREVDVVNGVGLPDADGLLHVPRSITVPDLTRRTNPGPLVLLGEHITASPFAHVTIDNHAAAVAATDHLLARGARSLAMIGPRTTVPSDAANRRFAGYRDALEAHGLPFDESLVGPVRAFTAPEGYSAAGRLLDDGVSLDGVVAANDSLALGVLAALAERGIAVPGEVRVIGMDGVQAGRWSSPPLTTVEPDRELMVERALTVLEQQFDAPPAGEQPVEQVTVPFRVLERGSTATG